MNNSINKTNIEKTKELLIIIKHNLQEIFPVNHICGNKYYKTLTIIFTYSLQLVFITVIKVLCNILSNFDFFYLLI